MSINRNFVRRHITVLAIILYLISYCIITLMKPGFLYNRDGSLREFGVGFRNKTVVPAWLLSISLAILSYFVVLYYLAAPKLINF